MHTNLITNWGAHILISIIIQTFAWNSCVVLICKIWFLHVGHWRDSCEGHGDRSPGIADSFVVEPDVCLQVCRQPAAHICYARNSVLLYCRQSLNLVLVLLKSYTQRDVYACLLVGYDINTDMTFIYTVQAVERYKFPEWPTLPDLCSVDLQGELGRICLVCCITEVRFCCVWKDWVSFYWFWLSLQHSVAFEAFRMSVFKPFLLI